MVREKVNLLPNSIELSKCDQSHTDISIKFVS